MNQNADLCCKTIRLACDKLRLDYPGVYFINETANRTELYDNNLNFISEDTRDIGYKVKNIRFIPKEYVIYINTRIFINKVQMLSLCYQTVRFIYQINEIKKGDESQEKRMSQWKYCYESPPRKDRTYLSPVEMDMMAFAVIMLKWHHNINLKYKNIKNVDFEKYIERLSKEKRLK